MPGGWTFYIEFYSETDQQDGSNVWKMFYSDYLHHSCGFIHPATGESKVHLLVFQLCAVGMDPSLFGFAVLLRGSEHFCLHRSESQLTHSFDFQRFSACLMMIRGVWDLYIYRTRLRQNINILTWEVFIVLSSHFVIYVSASVSMCDFAELQLFHSCSFIRAEICTCVITFLGSLPLKSAVCVNSEAWVSTVIEQTQRKCTVTVLTQQLRNWIWGTDHILSQYLILYTRTS